PRGRGNGCSPGVRRRRFCSWPGFSARWPWPPCGPTPNVRYCATCRWFSSSIPINRLAAPVAWRFCERYASEDWLFTMTTNEATHPDKTTGDTPQSGANRSDGASAHTPRADIAGLAAAQRANPRLAALLGIAACLLALIGGVVAGLFVRASSSEARALAPR